MRHGARTENGGFMSGNRRYCIPTITESEVGLEPIENPFGPKVLGELNPRVRHHMRLEGRRRWDSVPLARFEEARRQPEDQPLRQTKRSGVWRAIWDQFRNWALTA
jgi:hypothetical protein